MGRPGFGLAAAARSSVAASVVTKARLAAASGLAAPSGGIMPTRTLRITFSQVSAWAGASASVSVSSVNPAALTRSLWQVTQYCLRRASESDAAELRFAIAEPLGF